MKKHQRETSGPHLLRQARGLSKYHCNANKSPARAVFENNDPERRVCAHQSVVSSNRTHVTAFTPLVQVGAWLAKILNHGALRPRIVQELCESRGGRPGLSVLTSLLVSVDVKIYCTVLRHWSQLVPNMSHDI